MLTRRHLLRAAATAPAAALPLSILTADCVQAQAIELLKIGRHVRLSAQTVVIVGRDEGENALVRALASPSEWLLEVRECGSPLALLRGAAGPAELVQAAAITVHYSDAPPPGATVHCVTADGRVAHTLWSAPMGEAELAALRL